jgi:hypothetical protein
MKHSLLPFFNFHSTIFYKYKNEKSDRILKIQIVTSVILSISWSYYGKKKISYTWFGITPLFHVHFQFCQLTWHNFKSLKLQLWQTLPFKHDQVKKNFKDNPTESKNRQKKATTDEACLSFSVNACNIGEKNMCVCIF